MEVSKRVTRTTAPDGTITEITEEAKASVEVGETAPEGKGVPYAKSLKIFANNAAQARREAAAELALLRKALREEQR